MQEDYAKYRRLYIDKRHQSWQFLRTMSNESNKKDNTFSKPVAVIAFISMIFAIAWLSVQLVSFVPGAFSSLASLAESINQRAVPTEEMEAEEIIIASSKSIITAGEFTSLSWDASNVDGSYMFSYDCADGVSLNIIDNNGNARGVSCDTSYDIGNTTNLTLETSSEKNRYENIYYDIELIGTENNHTYGRGGSSYTVVNSTISHDDEETEPESEQTEDTPEPEVAVDPEPSTPAVSVEEPEYQTPIIDAVKRTDLATQFIASGNIISNVFVPGQIERRDSGAIQFAVKNLGLKTSNVWTYAVTLPSGETYRSGGQDPLGPSERAVITVGFPTPNTGSHAFQVMTYENTDENSLNDGFVETVLFSN